MALSACSAQYRLRYRLTVVVDTPPGERFGSGVYQLKIGNTTTFPTPGSTLTVQFKGDAFPIRLEGGRSIYVLLYADFSDFPLSDLKAMYAWNHTRYLLMGHTETNDWKGGRNRSWEQLAAIQEGEPIDIPLAEMPALAYFADPTQPDSGVLLAPNDLSLACGPGCAVKRCEMRLTSAPVTRGIAKDLPWVPGALPRGTFAEPLFSENRDWFTS